MQHDAQTKTAQTPHGYDYTDCFKHVKEEIQKADLAIGNLEVTLAGKPYRGYPSFSAPDDYLKAIKDAGFDLLLTANNHCLDKGKRGLERTIQMLDSVRMLHTGTYRNEEERNTQNPLLVEVGNFRIIFLNYTYDTNGLKPSHPNIVDYIDKNRMKEDIQKARKMRPDAIIACMHWGIEYHQLPEKPEKQLAEWLISQGVDHVIGSHPHVVQPMEVRESESTPQKHVIAYSLGNFISNMSKPNTDGGAMIKLELKKTGRHTRLSDCRYALVWTSRPPKNKKKNFEVYPVSENILPLCVEELESMNLFLNNTRSLFDKHNKGVKEYFF